MPSPTDRPRADLLITGAAEVLTCVPTGDDPAGRKAGAAIAVGGERILAVGSPKEVAVAVDTAGAEVLDVAGRVVAPGFVDCHTHLVFGGSRAREYALRMTHTPDEIRRLGIPTGILATVERTRAAGAEELTAAAADRLGRMFRCGTTTAESKSGYGLSTADEMRMLEVNRRLRESQPVDVVSTFLGAHAVPPEMPREEYVDLVVGEMTPQVAERGLAEYTDVFCDEGYFTAEDARRVLEAGLAAGLRAKIHVDEYADIGGSQVAAELGVVSADHLNHTSREGMRRLAEAGVVGVVMPALDFAVAHPRPFDARAMLAEGMTLALATDLCPGCWVESMQVVMQLACRLHGLSPEEALAAATAGAARAVSREADRGSIEPGKLADLQVWDLPSFEDVIYRIGHNAVECVVKRGRVYDFSANAGRR